MSVSDPTPQGSSEDVVGFAMIPNWLARSTSLSPAAKALYVALSSRVGKTRVVWPSQQRLVAETGLSESTLRRALRVLERTGLVETRTETTPTGKRNSYVIHTSIREGGSGHTDRTGPVSVTGKEEPQEEEPNTPPHSATEHSPRPLSERRTAVPESIKRRGKMTSSWQVSREAGEDAVKRFPNVNHRREMETFRDWHIGQDSPSRTQVGWDSMFLAWCARKQEAYEKDHPGEAGVERDPITGMPVNPKPRP